MQRVNKQLYRKGVGAFLLDSSHKKVFLGKRITPSNAWQLPQGGVDKNESLEEALLRELEEEIGTNKVKIIAKTEPFSYNFPKDITESIYNGLYIGQEQVWFALEFKGHDSDINLEAGIIPEFNEWRWEDPYKITNIAVNFKKELYKNILLAFKNWI